MKITTTHKPKFDPIEITIKVESQRELDTLRTFKVSPVKVNGAFDHETANNIQCALHRELLNI